METALFIEAQSFLDRARALINKTKTSRVHYV